MNTFVHILDCNIVAYYYNGYPVLLHTHSNIDHWSSTTLLQFIPRNMHTVFALLCFIVVIHWLIFPYLSGLLHRDCGNLTIVPVPAKQPWWIWINTSCEFIMNDCITTTKQSTTKPCAYFLGYTVLINANAILVYTLQISWSKMKSAMSTQTFAKLSCNPCNLLKP